MTRVLAILVLLAGTAHAFSYGGNFDSDPIKGQGGAGIVFDGAPRFTAHTCDVCHTGAPHTVGLRVESDDASLFDTGWTAAKQYHMRVVLLNEHAGAQYQKYGMMCGGAVDPYVPCDNNGFALEIDDAGGHPVGKFVPVSNNACYNMSGTPPVGLDSIVVKDGTAVVHNGIGGELSWDFCWTAPPAGAGVLTAYVAAVDGSGGDGTDAFPTDTVNDDVATGQIPINENGAAPPPPQTGGCSTTGDASLGVVLVVLLAWCTRRRFAAVLALAAFASGCVHVRPRERETLAKRSMKFSPDPLEDELDLHMQEAREGSSGGYGSSGGGCGCD